MLKIKWVWWYDPEIWKHLLSLECYEATEVRGVEIQALNNLYLEARAMQECFING